MAWERRLLLLMTRLLKEERLRAVSTSSQFRIFRENPLSDQPLCELITFRIVVPIWQLDIHSALATATLSPFLPLESL